MKILIIGSGGREHAIGQKLFESPQKPELYFAPGNPGVTELGQRLELDVMDMQGLRLFALREQIDLTIVGPEAPLAIGLADDFRKHGLLVFGPDQNGAQIEASKAFAKKLMQEANVPTAGYRFCDTKAQALTTLSEFSAPYVIKEDGLAAGKGVTIAQTRLDAEAAIEKAFSKNMPVVIEEFLTGEELSILAICDGQRALPMIGAQDFKRLKDNNEGPNTGGMGAYAPVSLATPQVIADVQEHVLDPMMKIFQARGIDYKGVLYAGLMIDKSHINVIEFNCRFGDPETQVVLPLLEDDLASVLTAAANGDLSSYSSGLRFKSQCAVTVVLAAEGYPDNPQKLQPIQFPQYLSQDTYIFHAGTRRMPDETTVTHGGRVLNVTGLGDTLATARAKAYEVAGLIKYNGKFYRNDIALAASLNKVR